MVGPPRTTGCGLSSALLTDHYELTMLDAALTDGTAGRTSVFQCFARHLPAGRRYGVVAGLGRLVDLLEDFTFDETDLAWLDDAGVVRSSTLEHLAKWRFTGDVFAFAEGEIYLPDEPVLTVVAPFDQAVVLETLVLSVLNHDSAVASAAARMVGAADGRDLLEFGSRRTHEEAAVAAARAAYVVGFDGTSNLAAGKRYGVPTLGTAAHAWTMLHEEETQAFAAQVETVGVGTTLLVDTYDVPDGLRNALDAAGSDLGGVRIDSGDLGEWAGHARTFLDERGATDTRIVVSGDLDEYAIAALAAAPIDGYGVGTRVVTGSGAPTADLVYKLVARSREPGGPPDVPVAKSSGDKATAGGRDRVTRVVDDGVATADVLTPWEQDPPDGRALQVKVVAAGEVVHRQQLSQIRDHHRSARGELPEAADRLDDGQPVIETNDRTPASTGART